MRIILNENQGHMGAETLYQYARGRDRPIGIAAVYRTLAYPGKAAILALKTKGNRGTP
jgi:Fe2+ or Zn2+ uptake regulation protein